MAEEASWFGDALVPLDVGIMFTSHLSTSFSWKEDECHNETMHRSAILLLHTSATAEWLQHKKTCILEWPTQSPTEMLWHGLKKQNHTRKPKNIVQVWLKLLLQEVHQPIIKSKDSVTWLLTAVLWHFTSLLNKSMNYAVLSRSFSWSSLLYVCLFMWVCWRVDHISCQIYAENSKVFPFFFLITIITNKYAGYTLNIYTWNWKIFKKTLKCVWENKGTFEMYCALFCWENVLFSKWLLFLQTK